MLTAFLFSILFNLGMFIVAYLFKTDKLTDISYSLTFIIIALYLFFKNFEDMIFTKFVLLIMICVWAIRLGSYLLYRIQKISRDKRFDAIRHDFLKFLRFWVLQGITVFIIFIPSIFIFTESNIQFNNFSIIGIVLFLFGLLYETTADIQKFKFMNTAKSQANVIQTGLWSYSRHPNYFGEICVWIGVFLYCSFYLSYTQTIISIISPLFIFFLLRYVSGIPLLEKAADLKFGHIEDYQKYKLNTPILFPKFWSKK